MLRSRDVRDVYPGSEFFPSRIRTSSIPYPGSASKNLSIITQKIVSKLSEIWSGLFIPDTDPDFFYPFRMPDAGVKRAPDRGSATLIAALMWSPCALTSRSSVMSQVRTQGATTHAPMKKKLPMRRKSTCSRDFLEKSSTLYFLCWV